MTSLDCKMFRDLWQMRGQALAIGLVIACGVATFVMSLCTLTALSRTQQAYYDRYRFADVFAQLKRAPDAVAGLIAAIPGVSRVETRVVQSVVLDIEGMAEPALGRLLSIPEVQTPSLNDRYLREGRYIEPRSDGEVLVTEGFASAHGFHPGDSVRAVINGRKRRLGIVGVALSPEFIYQIRDGDILPDDRRFGVFWMGEEALDAAFDMKGAFNDISLRLAPGASEPEVIRRLDRITAPYGGLGAFGRADHPSHKFINNELEELKGMALFVPSIFLSVAAFLLNVVVARLVGAQREQIATLKAFGYTRAEVGWHYLKLVLMVVAIGVALGTVVGVNLGRGIAVLYTKFFHFPLLEFRLEPGVVVLATALSAVAAILGTVGAVYRAVRLPPAEAMRPEPPANFRPTLLERAGLGRWLSPGVRMILRQLERQGVRTFLSVLGIAMAVAVLVLGNFMVDAINHVMETQFVVAQRQDVTVAFIEPSPSRALSDLRDLPGVLAVEPYRGLPTRIHSGHLSRRVGILAIKPDARLFRLVDIKRKKIPLPEGGIVLSAKLAEILQVGPGDSVTIDVLEGRRPTRSLPVEGLIEDFSGVSAYLSIQAANTLMEEDDLISGAYLAVDPDRIQALYDALKNAPRVPSVTIKAGALESFQSTVAENLLRMRLFNVIFASIISAGVVYNCARVALAERSRELATLRVIGFTRAEISFLLLGELGLITAVAIPMGLAMGYGMAYGLIANAYDSEMFRIPLVISRFTYGFAATVTAIAAVVSGLIVRRGLDRLDLIAVLKSKE